MRPVPCCLLLLAASCGRPDGAANGADLLEVAEAHARKHLPAAQIPTGVERAWLIEDHGDLWIVEFFRQGYVGGGIRMMIRKSDIAVVDTTRTQ